MSTSSSAKPRKIAPNPHPSSPTSRSNRTNPGERSSHTASSLPLDNLPRGVRHRPPEMRTEIRRKQNNDSAKRGRERRRVENEEIKSQVKNNTQRIKKLENQVGDLEATLKEKRKTKKRGKDKGSAGTEPGEFFEQQKFFGDAF